MDEPGAFLDPKHEEQLYVILQKLNAQKNKTLVVVSHDFNRSAVSSRRIIALKSAALAFDGLPADFMRGEVLEEIYGTNFSLVRHPENGCSMSIPSLR